MDILNLLAFKKKQPVLVRCTYCYFEFDLSPREVRILESKNAHDPVCWHEWTNYTKKFKQGYTELVLSEIEGMDKIKEPLIAAFRG